MNVGEIIPPEANVSRLALAPEDVVVISLPGPMPEGFMDSVSQLLAYLPKHAKVVVFDDGTTIATATVEELRAAIDEKEPPPTERLWVNEQRTVLARQWASGKVEVAFRDEPDHVWGPPVYLDEEKT